MNSEQRTQNLAPQVTRFARFISRNSGLPADEVEQEMWVSILTHGDRYQADKNLLIKASLDAKQKLLRDNNPHRRTAKYLPKTLQIVSDYSQPEQDNDQDWVLCDINATGTEAIALRHVAIQESSDVRTKVRQQVEALSGQRRQVANLLMEGYRPSEIADQLKITRPAVSYHISQLRVTLAPYRSLCTLL